MNENQNIRTWLDTAVSGIRFGPDQQEIREELRAHIEDKTADLERIFPDISPQEARDRALAGMGDPEELKISLARVHRPWLGYLWRASQVLLVLALAVLAWRCAGALLNRDLGGWITWEDARDWDYPQAVALEPARNRVKTDGFTITMREAFLWTHTYPEGGEERRLTVVLRRSSPCFWLSAGKWDDYISAEDSAGTHYPSYVENWSDGSGDWQSVIGHGGRKGLFHTDYELMIPLEDPTAEWVRLDYDWLGRKFSFTVNLKGAET